MFLIKTLNRRRLAAEHAIGSRTVRMSRSGRNKGSKIKADEKERASSGASSCGSADWEAIPSHAWSGALLPPLGCGTSASLNKSATLFAGGPADDDERILFSLLFV